MNADIITNLDYPHGTIEGFGGGCNTSHCPADVSCAVVHTRYVGDWAFRKQINAGKTPTEIVAEERKQAQEAADADLRAKQAERAVRSHETREKARERHNAVRRAQRAANLIPRESLIPRHVLRELLNQGLTDREIGDRLGLTRRQVAGTRSNAGWERNPDPNRKPAPVDTGASL